MTNEQIEAIKTRRAAFRANTINAEDFWQLTTEDIDALLAALEHPAQPTEMQKAVEDWFTVNNTPSPDLAAPYQEWKAAVRGLVGLEISMDRYFEKEAHGPAQQTVETSNSYKFTPGEPCPYAIESVRQPICDVQPAQTISDSEVERIYAALKSAMGDEVFTLRQEIKFIASAVLAEMGRR